MVGPSPRYLDQPHSPRRKYITVPGYCGHVSQMRYQHSRTFKEDSTRAFVVAEQHQHKPKPNSLVPYVPSDLYADAPNPRRKTNVKNHSSIPQGDPRKRAMVTTNVGMCKVERPNPPPRELIVGWNDFTKEERKHAYATAVRFIGMDSIKPLINAFRHKIMCKTGGPAALSRTFKWFDLDGSGDIDVDEFCQAMKFFGLNFTDMQVLSLFAIYDNSMNGCLEYYEFVQKVMADTFNDADVKNNLQKLLSAADKRERVMSADVLSPFLDAGIIVMPKDGKADACKQVYQKFQDPHTGLMPYENLVELMEVLEENDCPDPEQAIQDYSTGDSLSKEQFWEWWQYYVARFHNNRHGDGEPTPEDERIGPEGDGHSWQHSRRRQGRPAGSEGDWEDEKNASLDLGDDNARDHANMIQKSPMPPSAPAGRPQMQQSWRNQQPTPPRSALAGSRPNTARFASEKKQVQISTPFEEDNPLVPQMPRSWATQGSKVPQTARGSGGFVARLRESAGRPKTALPYGPPQSPLYSDPSELCRPNTAGARSMPIWKTASWAKMKFNGPTTKLESPPQDTLNSAYRNLTETSYSSYNKEFAESRPCTANVGRALAGGQVSWAGTPVRRITNTSSGTVPLSRPATACPTGYKL